MNVPSGYSALDLVGFTDKGDYLPSATYVKNDLVHYNDKIWKCLIDDTTAIEPTEGVNWTLWIQQSNSLDGLADVEITNAQDGQEITYDGTTQKWKNTSKIQTLTNQVKDMNNVYGSKNLLLLTSYSKGETVSLNGGTIKCNEDGSYTINGTFTSDAALKIDWLVKADRREISNLADKILIASCNGYNTSDIQFYTGCFKTDGTASQVDSGAYGGTPRQYTMPSDAYTFRNWISIAAKTYSNVTIYPMVCLASVYELSSDWQSPAKTNQQLTQDTTGLLDNTEVNGAVNYIYPFDSTRTDLAGVTWTLNSDNSVSVNSGGIAPSTGTGFSYRNNNAAFLRGKTVTFKANVTGNTPTYDKLYFAVICRETENGANLVRYDVWPTVGQTEVTFTVPDNTNYILIGCNIQNGATTAIDCKISPIVSLASYNGDYVPYAKSNKELTEDVNGGFILINPRYKVAEVTADGTKTNATLLAELCSATSTTVGQIASNLRIKLDCISISGYDAMIIPAQAFFTNTDTISSISAFIIHTTGSGMKMETVIGRSSDSRFRAVEINISNGNITPTNGDSVVPANGKKFTIYAELYRVVS